MMDNKPVTLAELTEPLKPITKRLDSLEAQNAQQFKQLNEKL